MSAAEKLGVELLLVDEVPPADDVSEEPVELEPEVEPEADGLLEDEDGVLVLLLDDEDGELEDEDGVLEDEDGELDEDDGEDDDCATASVDSAKSTAADMMLRDLGMDGASRGLVKTAPTLRASRVPLSRCRDRL